MESLNKSQKMVRILDLMSRVGGVRAEELMRRFDLDQRGLRRYLADLRAINVPVSSDGRGDERVVAVDARWRRTGVRLTLSEVLSLHFGRRLFNFLDGTSFADDLDGAIERLQPAISREHAELTHQLGRRFIAVPEPSKDYTGEASEVIDEVHSAIIYDNPIDIRYRKAAGRTSRYRLHPYTLAVYRQGLYLFAYDTDAGMVKTFATERVVEIARQRLDKFFLPDEWDPEAHLEHAFGIITGQPIPVKVAFAPDSRTYIMERSWHPTQTIERRSDGWVVLQMEVALTVELVSWIRSFGDEAKVIEPTALRDRVAESLRRAAARYA